VFNYNETYDEFKRRHLMSAKKENKDKDPKFYEAPESGTMREK